MVTFSLNGVERQGYEGESVAAAILCLGEVIFRKTRFGAAPRSFYCGMGVCQECLVTLDGRENVRACMKALREGMIIQTVEPGP